jgi:hypothetical protein
MSFIAKVENVKKTEEGSTIYPATEEFINEINRLYKLATLQIKSSKEKSNLDFTIDDEEMAFFLADNGNLGFDDVLETKEQAHFKMILKFVEELHTFEEHVIKGDVKEAQKIVKTHGNELLALNKLLSRGGITIQQDKGGQVTTLPKSPKINLNISVDACTHMNDCVISKIENKESTWVATFDGFRNSKVCKAELIVSGDQDFEDQLFNFMKNQQLLDIEVCYKETINDKTCKKIHGSLLTVKNSLTQMRLPISL